MPLSSASTSSDPSAGVELRWTARAAIAVVGTYQLLLRPLIAGSGACRFTPSCSEYAREAILIHGAARGGWIGLKRLLRCHPFGGSGFDPVPPFQPHCGDRPHQHPAN